MQVLEQRHRAQDADAHLLRERLLQRPEELLEVGAPELEAERLADRDDVRVARLVEHERHLAEVVPPLQRHQMMFLRTIFFRALHLAVFY